MIRWAKDLVWPAAIALLVLLAFSVEGLWPAASMGIRMANGFVIILLQLRFMQKSRQDTKRAEDNLAAHRNEMLMRQSLDSQVRLQSIRDLMEQLTRTESLAERLRAEAAEHAKQVAQSATAQTQALSEKIDTVIQGVAAAVNGNGNGNGHTNGGNGHTVVTDTHAVTTIVDQPKPKTKGKK